jgi:AmmeMemoRadiSam system protein B
MLMKDIREPAVAGQFYAASRDGLIKQIEESFKSEFGPGALPKKSENKRVIGAIVPHAGYVYSGPCASHAYSCIASAKKPDVFVILGTNHHMTGGNATMLGSWKTPLGIARIDECFAKALDIDINPNAHRFEHSIEVQLPFLQYVMGNSFSFVPISVSDVDDLHKHIVTAIGKTEKGVTVIASSDMTHYGFNFAYLPFVDNAKANMYKLDKGAIDRIASLDDSGFLKYIGKTGATICGAMPITVLIRVCKALGTQSAKLLKYYTSGDIIGDYSSAVGYASMVIQ